MKANKVLKINHLVFLVISFISMFFLNSCSASGESAIPGGPDTGVITHSYMPFKTITFNDNQYELRKNNLSVFLDQYGNDKVQGLIYYINNYEVGTDDANLSNWSINYKLNTNYLDPNNKFDDEFIKYVYSQLETTIMEFQILFDVELDYYPEILNIEKEFKVEMNKGFDSIIVIDAYLPIQIYNLITTEVNYIYVPVKSLLAYNSDNNLEVIIDNQIIKCDYYRFMQIEGMKNN